MNSLSNIYIYHYPQTLTTLNLTMCGINDQGVEYLAIALQNNNVIQIFYFYVLYTIFL